MISTLMKKVSQEKQCGYYIHPYYRVPPKPHCSHCPSVYKMPQSPYLSSLSYTVFPVTPHTPWASIMIPHNSPSPSFPTAFSHPFPLVTTSPFSEYVSLCYFVPSVLLRCYTPQMREIIWHLSFFA